MCKRKTLMLDKIKNIAADINNMSFIVGAGFSLNISKEYPTWQWLLRDMIDEMYADEMHKKYFFWGKYDDKEYWRIIDKYGYLGIASEYVRRIGGHEAIDLYIEKRTPILIPNNNGKGYSIEKDGNVLDENADTTIHRMLLDLRPKNIYTFNYDNSLDVYNDLTFSPDDKNELIEAKKKKDLLQDADIEYERRFKTYQQKSYDDIESHETIGNRQDNEKQKQLNSLNEMIASGILRELNLREIDAGTSETNAYYENRRLIYREISKYTDKINRLEILQKEGYIVVTKGTDISITSKNRCIYKLHGSYSQGDEGFDYDNYTKYIITQEDYDTYEEKHEPFVDLMRISLLRDAFCIIGFSGDDPNFKLWINWVKDVMDKSSHYDETSSKKYFINASKEVLSEDKQLMLKHRKIKIINLFEAYPTAKDEKERVLSFLKDLSGHEIDFRKESKLWSSIKIDSKISKIDDLEYDKEALDSIIKSGGDGRFRFLFNKFHYFKEKLLDTAFFLSKNKWINESIAKLLLYAIDEENLPFRAYQLSKQDFECLPDKSDAILYLDLCNLDAILSNIGIDSDLKETNSHIDILKYLYCFDFKQAIEKIKTWNPYNSYDRTLKKMWSKMFKIDNEDINVKSMLERKNHDGNTYFQISLQMIQSMGDLDDYSTIQGLRRKKTEDDLDISNIIKFYLGNLEEKGKVRPLGTVNKSFKMGEYNGKLVYAIKIIYTLAKLGMQANPGALLLVSKQNWLKVVEQAYDYFPMPCIYYTVSYGDDKLSERVAQILCYTNNDRLTRMFPEILNIILNAILSVYTPQYIRKSLLIFARHLLAMVDEKEWSDKFIECYNYFGGCSANVDADEVVNFITAGISNLKNKPFLKSELISCLNKKDKTEYTNSLIIECRNYIDNKDPDVHNALERIMQEPPSQINLFVILNMSNFIDEKKIQEWLCDIDDKLLNQGNALNGAAWHAADSKALNEKLCEMIINNNKLWDTGLIIKDEKINGRTVSSPLHFAYFQRFLSFSERQIANAYKKLKVALSLLGQEKTVFTFGFLDNSSQLLFMMKSFLEDNDSTLKKEIDYDNTVCQCESELVRRSGGRSILEDLHSTDPNEIIDALKKMEYRDYENRTRELKQEYVSLIGIICMRQSQSLSHCFNRLAGAISNNPDFFNDIEFEKCLSTLLSVYEPYFIGNSKKEWNLYASKELVEQCLMIIVDKMKNYGTNIGGWNDYKPLFVK